MKNKLKVKKKVQFNMKNKLEVKKKYNLLWF